jgi:hypothetical protein
VCIAGSTVVTVIADSGERYRTKQWSKTWLAAKGLVSKATGTAVDFVL